jgi:hypothetical protein
MKRFALLLALGLAGCRSTPPPPPPAPAPVLITPGSTLIYHDADGHGIWTFCDRGNRVYLDHTGHYQVVPNGCPDGRP